jgi:hypothetical protein
MTNLTSTFGISGWTIYGNGTVPTAVGDSGTLTIIKNDLTELTTD